MEGGSVNRSIVAGFLPALFYFKGDEKMDMLSGNVRRIYLKYLTAAFGSALISSIYGIVDVSTIV